MRYLPHTEKDVAAMLDRVGVQSLEHLFSSIPDDCRRQASMVLPEPLSEWELNDHMRALAQTMAVSPQTQTFIGAGSYEHYIPAVVSGLLSRSEFVTSYTPYQPEMTQGTLQAIYEYQTMTARLLGMAVANASLYDGASALAEAILMAGRITGRKKVALSSVVHPHYRAVAHTYLGPSGFEVVALPYTPNGETDLSEIEKTEDLAAVVVQSPNFFGCIEKLQAFAQKAHEKEALLIASFTEPLAFGLLRSPGGEGADIACGEGQSLGIPQSFGGPGLGMFAGKMAHVRNMPGRLVGETVDKTGQRGFVLTLATREQHIRREKATSNICTNNSLCALCAAIYMASLGGTGIRGLARVNYDKSGYLKKELSKAGVKIAFEGATFNEFVVKMPAAFASTYRQLAQQGIVAGLALASYYPELDDHYLLCATETKSRQDMDDLVRKMAS